MIATAFLEKLVKTFQPNFAYFSMQQRAVCEGKIILALKIKYSMYSTYSESLNWLRTAKAKQSPDEVLECWHIWQWRGIWSIIGEPSV